MKRTILVCLLTGCSLTPADLREVEPFTYALKSEPAKAAHCIRDNAEAYHASVSAEIRGPEVLIRHGGAIGAIARLKPTANGSIAQLYISHTYPKADFADFYVRGC